MKKFIALAASVLMITCLAAGCAGKEVITYIVTGEAIEISVDGEFVISLDSNPSTGHSWVASYDETKLELVDETYKADETGGLVLGAGGTEYFRFKALRSGVATITLDYKMAGGTDSAKQSVFTVDID
jgi:inhibitor of cysteine peptidase